VAQSNKKKKKKEKSTFFIELEDSTAIYFAHKPFNCLKLMGTEGIVLT
jgi:hypothetical protein